MCVAGYFYAQNNNMNNKQAGHPDGMARCILRNCRDD